MVLRPLSQTSAGPQAEHFGHLRTLCAAAHAVDCKLEGPKFTQHFAAQQEEDLGLPCVELFGELEVQYLIIHQPHQGMQCSFWHLPVARMYLSVKLIVSGFLMVHYMQVSYGSRRGGSKVTAGGFSNERISLPCTPRDPASARTNAWAPHGGPACL